MEMISLTNADVKIKAERESPSLRLFSAMNSVVDNPLFRTQLVTLM